MATAPELVAAVRRLCTGDALEIEIDLREVPFLDSHGLRAILAAREACANHRVEFFLFGGKQRRLFEVMGLLDVLPWREPPT